MASQMKTMVPTQLLDVLQSMILSILMVLAFQAVLPHIEMSGTMDLISVIPLAALVGILNPRESFVKLIVNLNTFDSKMIFFTVCQLKVKTIVQTVLSSDAPQSMNLCTPMAHAYPLVPPPAELNSMIGVNQVISVTPFVLLDPISILWSRSVLIHAKMSSFDLKIIFFGVMIHCFSVAVLLILASSIPTILVAQVAIIHTELKIMKEADYVIPLVKTDTLML